MSRINYIIPECYIDTNLIKTLLNVDGVNHQKGCNQVCKVIKEKFADKFAVGIIDNDKMKPPYLSEFKEIAHSEHIALFKHPQKAHFIITISPAMEGFILDNAQANDIVLSEYNLPSDLDAMKLITKDVQSDKEPRFRKFFYTMAYCGEFHKLQKALNYLSANTYQSECNELKKMIEN